MLHTVTLVYLYITILVMHAHPTLGRGMTAKKGEGWRGRGPREIHDTAPEDKDGEPGENPSPKHLKLLEPP